MISEPTVLILGAGASKEYGFPTALELRQLILTELGGPRERLSKALQELGHTWLEIVAFRDAFANSGRRSIDAFLEYRTEFLAIGKHAIAGILLPLELPQVLLRTSNLRWYDILWDAIDDASGKAVKDDLTIITFNYDRSLEQYLGLAFSNSYKGNDKAVSGFLGSCHFIHVYGSLSPLAPWAGPNGRPYEPTIDPGQITAAASQIRVVRQDEDLDADPAFGRARTALLNAKRICFLGFGYDRLNLDRLRFAPTVRQGTAIYGTVFGLMREELRLALQNIQRDGPRSLIGVSNPLAATYDCTGYLRHYGVFAT